MRTSAISEWLDLHACINAVFFNYLFRVFFLILFIFLFGWPWPKTKMIARKKNGEDYSRRCYWFYKNVRMILHININLFVVQQSFDHIQMSFPYSTHQCGHAFLHFFIINKIHQKKKKNASKKIRKRSGDAMWRNQHSTNHFILQININLFEVQQSIDHLQMSIHWSTYQCGIATSKFILNHLIPPQTSTLCFINTINKIFIKKNAPKRNREETWTCNMKKSTFY